MAKLRPRTGITRKVPTVTLQVGLRIMSFENVPLHRAQMIQECRTLLAAISEARRAIDDGRPALLIWLDSLLPGDEEMYERIDQLTRASVEKLDRLDARLELLLSRLEYDARKAEANDG